MNITHHMSAVSVRGSDITQVTCFCLFFSTALDMDYKVVFMTLDTVCEDIISNMCAPSDMPYGAVAKRLVTCMKEIQEHGRVLEPVVAGFISVFHHYDFDAQTPGNGYRTLVKVRVAERWHVGL